MESWAWTPQGARLRKAVLDVMADRTFLSMMRNTYRLPTTSPASLPQVKAPAFESSAGSGLTFESSASTPEPPSIRNSVTLTAQETRAGTWDIPGVSRRPTEDFCPESVTWSHAIERDGRCGWGCGWRGRGAAMPRLDGWRTELDAAYRQHWDPDWGTDPADV